jgi:hypothetical protein
LASCRSAVLLQPSSEHFSYLIDQYENQSFDVRVKTSSPSGGHRSSSSGRQNARHSPQSGRLADPRRGGGPNPRARRSQRTGHRR